MMKSIMEGKKSRDWVNLILAVCLFLSPWVLGFMDMSTAAWNAWIVGVALAVLAVATLSAFAEWEEWASAVLGLWLIVAPWALGFATDAQALFTHVVIGVLVAAFSAWTAWDYHQHPHSHA